MNLNRHDKNLTFEKVYPKAEFSELIRLALKLTDVGLRLWSRLRPDPGLRRSTLRSRVEGRLSAKPLEPSC